MKTAIVAVLFLVGIALCNAQNNAVECATRGADLASCLSGIGGSDASTYCSGDCVDQLRDFYNDCGGSSAGLDACMSLAISIIS